MESTLASWGKEYKFELQISVVKKQLVEPGFVRALNDFLIYNERFDEIIDYTEINLQEITSLVIKGETFREFSLIALYFVIDITRLFFNFDHPQIDQVNSFYSIADITNVEANCVNAAFMIENNFDIQEYLTPLLNTSLSRLFRFYFLEKFNEIGEYTFALRFYNFFNLEPDLNTSHACSIVKCLAGNDLQSQAIDFIRCYCAPNRKSVADEILYELLIDLYTTTMEKKDGDQKLSKIYFTKIESDFLQKYAKQVTPYVEWENNKFIKMSLDQ